MIYSCKSSRGGVIMAAKTSQEAKEALRLLQQGATVQEAMKAGVCESTCWRLIKLHGIAYKRRKKDNTPRTT